MLDGPLRAVLLCPHCQALGRLVLLDAELEHDGELLVVMNLDGCQHAEGFGDPEILTLEQTWRLIEAALDAVGGDPRC